MYARVARWEGADAEQLRASAEEVRSNPPSGPPPGVPSTGFTLLSDPDGGRTLAIALFETEEDMRTGDAALNAKDQTRGGVGSRTSVEMFEVAFEVRL